MVRLSVQRKFAAKVGGKSGTGFGARKKLIDYVRLPAEKYNVLDADSVKKIGDDGFVVAPGRQKLLWLEVEPRAVLQIELEKTGVRQRVTEISMAPVVEGKTERDRGLIAEIQNLCEQVSMENIVTAESENGEDELAVELRLEGEFERGIMARVPEAQLNRLVDFAVGVATPWFVSKLAQDFTDWSAGRKRRMNSGEIGSLARELMSGAASKKLPEGVREIALEKEQVVKEIPAAGDQ
mmetsp:Transcript_31194/g.101725  ORF Transcript_31194/g.101725 Transcript_31194/m.101725 type:complete len:238 (-) Transcript_31194:2037-2750(-)